MFQIENYLVFTAIFRTIKKQLVLRWTGYVSRDAESDIFMTLGGFLFL